MAHSSQRRAIANYRRRQSERGLCRHEVRGLDADKPLVRRIAARLAANDRRWSKWTSISCMKFPKVATATCGTLPVDANV